ncbi:MAG: pitrilysin family protein [Candidatus Eisenbacteria bacterium]
MNHFTRLTIALALVAASMATRTASAALDPKYDPTGLKYPTLNSIRTYKPERFVLKNGMVVYLQEDHRLPLVTGTLYCRASSAWAPAEKAGLGGLTGQVMRSGGSAAHNGDFLDDRLAAIGASINTGISQDFATASFRCLKENSTEVIGLLAEVLTTPAFPEDKLELGKVGLRRQIAQRNDDLTQVLNRVANAAIFGKDHPFVRQPEYATVDAISRADLASFHRLSYTPDRAYCVIYGDFKPADMKKLVTARFAGWKKSGIAAPAMPGDPVLGQPRLVFAPKEDVTQSGVMIGHLGYKASDPDHSAMDIYENVLGGGWQSRLFNKIRTERGLAYAAGASAGSGYARPGVFVAYSLTRSESTLVTTDLLRSEVTRSLNQPLGEEEVKRARESVLNSMVFNYASPSAAAFRSAYYEALGYPQDFLQRYQKGVEATTAASVQEAARRKVHPENFVTVIVGKEKDFDRPLSAVGLPLERVDITIPSPASKVVAGTATPDALANGGKWLAKATELAGGAAAWGAVKSIKTTNQLSVTMQGQSIQAEQVLSWQLPDRRVVLMKLPFGEMISGFDGKVGWRKMMGQIQDDPAGAKQASEEYSQSLFNLFANSAKLQVQAMPESKTVDGVKYDVALVKSEVVKDWMLYFGPDGRLGRMEFQSQGPQGPATETQVLGDWKPVGSIQFPHAITVLLNGEKYVEGKMAAAELNPALDAAMFAKPAN